MRAVALLICALAGCDGSPATGSDAARADAADPRDAHVPRTDAARVDAHRADAAIVEPTECTPLPPASGTVVEVTESDDLAAMVRDAAEDTTFVLADGVYRPRGGDEASRRIQIRARGITIRSASGDPDLVVIDGEYETNEIVGVYASDATLAEITLTHAVDHAVHVAPSDGGADITGTHLYRVRIRDCGEQFVKVNPPGARDAWGDEGLVECSHFELTDDGRPHVERAVGGCYTGGIDAHGARDWIVRDNTFVGIYCAGEGLAEHAIHFWTGSRGTLIERNRIVDCARGIGLGLVESGATREYEDDPYPGLYVGHYDGIVRNNVIIARIPFYDTGIELVQARGTQVHHNTIVETDAASARFSSIDARFSNTEVRVRNNLVRRLTVRDGASSEADHNLEEVPEAYFVDAERGDIHLTQSADDAIDTGVALDDAGLDVDLEPHDRGAGPDLGADER